MSWYWNQITDKDSARYATTTAIWLSYFFAIAGCAISIFSLVDPKSASGLDARWAFANGAVFGVIGWRIAHLSRFWAVAGFGLCSLEMVLSIAANGLSLGVVSPLIMGTIFSATYLNALRGTFAYHRYTDLQAGQVQPSPRSL